MAEQDVQPALMTTKQAAEFLSCGERTLWRWSRSGLAPKPVEIGIDLRPAVRYRRQDLEEWIAEKCPEVN